ncbi:RloB family protein [Bacillus wiedmannii]|uniref:RloB family protein n=1 Tax=Bacillus wiedmannii TaxID=1890302 RepID=UPI00159B9F0E|nr:RloB family protein [Bacillus wiedmannii]
MSLRTSREFGSRGPSQTEAPNKKFIFVFEGEKTEKQYFEGLFNSREELGIKDLIDIKTLEREDGSHSNQRKIVGELHTSLQEVLSLKMKKEEILKQISKLLTSMNIPNVENILGAISYILDGEDVEKWLVEVTRVIEELGIESEELKEFIEQLGTLKDLLDYEEDYDTVCIIIDRDRQSFKGDQYDEVLTICNTHGYKLGITNPCIEFWLLLHIKDCKEYNEEEIIKNSRVSNKRRYLESLLAQELGAYRKNNLKFEVFKSGIRDAIIRERMYCEDPDLLKDRVGSSVGVIINSLL